jgi:RHS repeat-associated protein
MVVLGFLCPRNFWMQVTGQRLESTIGLYYYGARWYDPAAGRFIQADSIVPGGVQGLDRYAYVGNNPVRYTDLSGHNIDDIDPKDFIKGWDQNYGEY